MIKVFYTSSENKNYFGVNQVLNSLKKFLYKKTLIYNTGGIYKFLSNKYDLIHIHGCWKIRLFVYFLLSKLRNIKIVISPHGMLDPHSLKNKKLIKIVFWHFCQKIIFVLSDQIIVNSILEKKNVLKMIKHNNIKIIPHGIKLELLNHKNKRLKKNPLKFVFFSKIHPSKNLLGLINLWTNKNFLKNLDLSIYGEITDNRYFEKVSKKISKLKNIKYHGALYKNKVKILSNYDVFIFPSKSENFGLVVLEALASGLYVIIDKNLSWGNLKKLGFASLITFTVNSLTKEIKNIDKVKNQIRGKHYLKKTRYFLKKKHNWNIISSNYLNNYKNLTN